MNWNFDIEDSEPSEKIDNGSYQQLNETANTDSKSKTKTLDKFKDMFSDYEA